VLATAKTELIIQLKKVLNLEVALAVRHLTDQGDFGDQHKEDVIGDLHDPTGYTPEKLTKKIRHMDIQLRDQQSVKQVDDSSRISLPFRRRTRIDARSSSASNAYISFSVWRTGGAFCGYASMGKCNS